MSGRVSGREGVGDIERGGSDGLSDRMRSHLHCEQSNS